MTYFIGIEGGGTKFVCAYGSGPEDLQDRTVIRTATPEITMRELVEYIRAVQNKVTIAAIGASIFGPLDLDHASPTFGYITTTPKQAWINFDFVGALQREFNCAVGFDTDVNAAAISEYRWGAAQNLSDVLYLTVGTGIGGGIIANHQLVHGAMHPEMGHILISQEKNDHFAGVCQYHGCCLEGLASGPAIKERWQVKSALDLPEDHPGWDLEASYLGQALANYTLTVSPKRIIIGGGVMRQNHLLPKVRQKLIQHLGGYIQNPTVIAGLDNYIVKPGLEENAGVLGAIAVAELALAHEVKRGNTHG
jgi:fructokinase